MVPGDVIRCTKWTFLYEEPHTFPVSVVGRDSILLILNIEDSENEKIKYVQVLMQEGIGWIREHDDFPSFLFIV